MQRVEMHCQGGIAAAKRNLQRTSGTSQTNVGQPSLFNFFLLAVRANRRLKWRLANDSPTLRGLRDPNPLEAGLHLMALQSVNWCTTFSLSPFAFAYLPPLFFSRRRKKFIKLTTGQRRNFMKDSHTNLYTACTFIVIFNVLLESLPVAFAAFMLDKTLKFT